MKKKVSLKDIAKEVGVSTATVSYVLSKGKESKVSEKVAERVRKAAKDMNYHPNQIAKSLKMGKTFTLGLIVADISNPFFSQIAKIIENEATKLNYTVVFGSSYEKAETSWDLLQFLANRQVDGFILAPTEDSEDQIKYLQDQRIPFVLIDRYFPEIQTNWVVIDNRRAAHNAVSRLIETGHKEVGMIGYLSSLHHMMDRIRGYQQAMKDHGLRVKKTWLHQIDFFDIREGVRNAIDEMLNGDNPVKAIFFATNTLAVYGLKYIDELDYKVPNDLAIVSFDQGEAFDFYYCPITYVKQPIDEMAEKALRLLVEQMEAPSADPQQICLEAELVVRKSCG